MENSPLPYTSSAEAFVDMQNIADGVANPVRHENPVRHKTPSGTWTSADCKGEKFTDCL